MSMTLSHFVPAYPCFPLLSPSCRGTPSCFPGGSRGQVSCLLSNSCPEEPPRVCPGGARPWVPDRWVLRLGQKPGPLTAMRSQTQVTPNAQHPRRPSKVSISASLDRVKVVRSGPSRAEEASGAVTMLCGGAAHNRRGLGGPCTWAASALEPAHGYTLEHTA